MRPKPCERKKFRHYIDSNDKSFLGDDNYIYNHIERIEIIQNRGNKIKMASKYLSMKRNKRCCQFLQFKTTNVIYRATCVDMFPLIHSLDSSVVTKEERRNVKGFKILLTEWSKGKTLILQ